MAVQITLERCGVVSLDRRQVRQHWALSLEGAQTKLPTVALILLKYPGENKVELLATNTIALHIGMPMVYDIIN